MADQAASRICAVIARTRHGMALAEIGEAVKQGARLVELRLDFLRRAPDFQRLLHNRPCPIIATVRRPEDGGRWNRSEEDRQKLLRQAIVAGFDYVDLEYDVAPKIPRFAKTRRIVSYHNMRGMPDDLEGRYADMVAMDADIVKIAVTAQHPTDNLRIFKLLENAKKPTVALCMGDLGTCSRVLGVKFGMPFTYAAFNKERSVAPGILSFADMKQTYNVDRIDKDTKIFGVIGDPVAHSLSPLIHNRAMEVVGFNGVYVPFRVPRGELQAFLQSFQRLPIHGFSVTIPHKEAVAKLACRRDREVEAMGAANTLVLGNTQEGYYAFNTDAQAAIESLKDSLPVDAEGEAPDLASMKVLIVGAGGVARAIAHAIRREGSDLTITNRTESKGTHLATEVNCKFVDWAGRNGIDPDIVINCTSVGMHPNLDESPLSANMLRPGMLVFDTIYTPETTMLIREARESGCDTLTGVDMFVRQAGLQFKRFTGHKPPLEMMARVVRRALSPVQLRDDDEL